MQTRQRYVLDRLLGTKRVVHHLVLDRLHQLGLGRLNNDMYQKGCWVLNMLLLLIYLTLAFDHVLSFSAPLLRGKPLHYTCV